jgi:hypothetical protein
MISSRSRNFGSIPIFSLFGPNSSNGCLFRNSFIGKLRDSLWAFYLFIFALSGALGAGLVIFSRYPIIEASTRPYSLNGSPIDVLAGDWFVGKAAASALISHPILGDVEVYNTHVRSSDQKKQLSCFDEAFLLAVRKRRRI